MPSYEKSSNGKWSVRFRTVEDGISKNKRLSGYRSKRAAEVAYTLFLQEHPSEKTASPNADMTVDELYTNYYAYIQNRNKLTSVTTVSGTLERYALPFFEKKKVRRLTAQDIIGWQQYLISTGNSQIYNIKIFAYFNTMLNFGKKYFDLPNVAEKVGNFRRTQKPREMHVWTEDDFRRFIAVVDDIKYKAVYSFLYLTGCRRGEALALKWSDIDLEEGKVHISKTCDFHEPGKSFVILDTPKNTSSIRDVYLPSSLIELLRKYKAEMKHEEDDFVFCGDEPMKAETLRRSFNEYSKTAGVPQIRIHDLRHSHASLLISKGQDIVTVAHRLGHKDIVQTLNTYSHFLPSKQRELLEAVNIDIFDGKN